MNSDFTFALALCKAQYGIWLRSLEMLETIGSRILQDGIALTRAETDAVMRAEDWHALTMAPMHALWQPDTSDASRSCAPAAMTQARSMGPSTSRRAAVNDALRILRGALAAPPSERRPHAGRKAATTRSHA